MVRADGSDTHAGALRGAGVDLRAQVRWHPPARIQSRNGCATVLTQSVTSALPSHRRRDCKPRLARCNSRWRNYLGHGGDDVSRVRSAVARWAQPDVSTSLRARLDSLALRPPLERVAPLSDVKPWERACSEGWEGVVAKRRDSLYEHRRSPHWLKMKCEESQELVVGGFTDPQGTRVGLGALLVGYYAEEDFVFAGKVGTGFDTKLLLDLRKQLDALEVPTSPFA